ncbi:MAG: N-formylglutamate amidohydrolase [Candidatus Latescibacterota bacterium]|nr:MAG: N-formylglutamate amidohydrolase [Candidatus Latescibacterota bacterium]
MSLPILISVPHAGLRIPEEITTLVELDQAEIRRDGDEQAAEIYGPLEPDVAAYVTTDIARAFVDLNRAEDDRRADGVVKTHTCFNVKVYNTELGEDLIETLLEKYHRPYHKKLTELAARGEARVGIDCHTMLATGPPVGPDPGRPRPAACVSNLDGISCPTPWLTSLAARLEEALGHEIALNDPFKGGFITRTHAAEIPWLQLEMSRGPFATVREKSHAVREAIAKWAAEL